MSKTWRKIKWELAIEHNHNDNHDNVVYISNRKNIRDLLYIKGKENFLGGKINVQSDGIFRWIQGVKLNWNIFHYEKEAEGNDNSDNDDMNEE